MGDYRGLFLEGGGTMLPISFLLGVVEILSSVMGVSSSDKGVPKIGAFGRPSIRDPIIWGRLRACPYLKHKTPKILRFDEVVIGA